MNNLTESDLRLARDVNKDFIIRVVSSNGKGCARGAITFLKLFDYKQAVRMCRKVMKSDKDSFVFKFYEAEKVIFSRR